MSVYNPEGPSEDDVLSILEARGPSAISEVAEVRGWTPRQVSTVIRRLERGGRVECVGKGKSSASGGTCHIYRATTGPMDLERRILGQMDDRWRTSRQVAQAIYPQVAPLNGMSYRGFENRVSFSLSRLASDGRLSRQRTSSRWKYRLPQEEASA